MDFLLAWQNLIFLTPILIGVFASLAIATGFGGEVGEGNAEAGESVDCDDASGDSTVGDVTDHNGTTGNGDGHNGHSMFQQALSLLGVGKVPLSIVIMLSNLSFGIVGITSNVLLGSSGLRLLASLAIAFGAMILITASCAKMMSRIVPSFESRTVSQRDLLGIQACLILPASPTSGLAHVRDQFGTLHQIRCRTAHGEIPDGCDVMAYDYDEKESVYLIEELPTLNRTRKERSANEQEGSQFATEQKKQSE